MDRLLRFFTDEARRALKSAQQEAKRLRHAQIGTEHLLLGLLSQDGGIAGWVLRQLGLQTGDVQHCVERLSTARRREPSGDVELDLTPRTQTVLQLAGDEARRLGEPRIDTHHLLLGLVRQGEGTALDVLNQLGVTPDQILSYTERLTQREPTARPKRRQSISKSSLVDQLATDLTALAEKGRLDPVIGRDRELERVIQILARRTKNNPALIGDPGVGKTAIVEGLAQRIVKGETPEPLLDKRVLQLDVGSLVAGTMYRGQFEERLQKIINELKNSDTILFIDEVHMLVGAGSAGSSVDAANILKPSLARGELQCIGATTMEEYRKSIEADAALERRFQPIVVEEPSIEETIRILHGVRPSYEKHHRLRISDDALVAAARLSARYIADRCLPDKAIDVVDEAASRVRMYKAPHAKDLQQLFAQLKSVQRDKEKAVEEHRHDDASALRVREVALRGEMDGLRTKLMASGRAVVDAQDVAEIVSMWTGVPLTQLHGNEKERLLGMEEALHQRIVAQDDAISAVARAVRRTRAGLKDPRRPMGSFIFLGPTGVGKTELSKALAEFLFGSEDALLQFDMSEFMEPHSVARLVGAPPGYVGYDDAGQLTEAIRRRPYSIVVFDEVEKAHPDTLNMLLQIMEEGMLSDARGRRVDFRNCMIVMTSNIGADLIKRQAGLGFSLPLENADPSGDYEAMRDSLLDELKRTFRPEFVNRLDTVVVFHALSRAHIAQIMDLELAKLEARLRDQEIELEVSGAARAALAEEGYSEEYGARPLRRVIQNRIEDLVSDALLAGDFRPGDALVVDATETEEGSAFVLRSPSNSRRRKRSSRSVPA
ncbi:MAG: ATP-dependent Clp protease ATP-binding subunit [Anaerolineales bacterium]|nr:MAG: ATP-dependent Clp protease ATP-binding subunit [Anaerolineales bacterium]